MKAFHLATYGFLALAKLDGATRALYAKRARHPVIQKGESFFLLLSVAR